jgi:hypothetical protein
MLILLFLHSFGFTNVGATKWLQSLSSRHFGRQLLISEFHTSEKILIRCDSKIIQTNTKYCVYAVPVTIPRTIDVFFTKRTAKFTDL